MVAADREPTWLDDPQKVDHWGSKNANGFLNLPEFVHCTVKNTPPKINIEPENDGLEDDFPLPGGVLSGSMLIFRGITASQDKLTCIFLRF